jgi:pantetheine-phosphate adenylyltransferase
MTKIAVYPGSFDPITNGHVDILKRSLEIFDRVIVAIADNVRKAPLFTWQERRDLLHECLGESDRIGYDAFSGLLISYCQRVGARTIVRGLRALADFEYEFQFAHMNRRLAPEIDTMFLMTGEENFYVSSSLVKEVASLGGDVGGLVPDNVRLALIKKYEKLPGGPS